MTELHMSLSATLPPYVLCLFDQDFFRFFLEHRQVDVVEGPCQQAGDEEFPLVKSVGSKGDFPVWMFTTSLHLLESSAMTGKQQINWAISSQFA